MTMKIQKIENTGVVYAEPSKPDHTVRVKHSSQPKSLGGVQVTNQITEVIVNDNAEVSIGNVDAVDALSIRVRISGSLQATNRKRVLLTALMATLDHWQDEDVLGGFNPVTVPVSAS